MSLFIYAREKRLIQAVEDNNIEYVNHLLNSKKSLNLNYKNRNGYTPLLLAIKLGERDEIIRLLLNKNLNINYKTKENESALHLAIPRYNLDIIQLLIENKINVNEQDKYGKTPVIRIIELIKKYTIPNEVLNESIIKLATATYVDGNSTDDDEPAPTSKPRKKPDNKILNKKKLKDESLFNDISLSSDFSWVENDDSGSLEVDEDFIDSLSISLNHVNVNELMYELLNDGNKDSGDSNGKEKSNSTGLAMSKSNSQETEVVNVNSSSSKVNTNKSNSNSSKLTAKNLNASTENVEDKVEKTVEDINPVPNAPKELDTFDVTLESKSSTLSDLDSIVEGNREDLNSKQVLDSFSISRLDSLSLSDEGNIPTLKRKATVTKKNEYGSSSGNSESENDTKMTATVVGSHKENLDDNISVSSLDVESSLNDSYNLANKNNDKKKLVREPENMYRNNSSSSFYSSSCSGSGSGSSSGSNLRSSSSVSSITLKDTENATTNENNTPENSLKDFDTKKVETVIVANMEVVTNNPTKIINDRKPIEKISSNGIRAVNRKIKSKLHRKFTFKNKKENGESVKTYTNSNSDIKDKNNNNSNNNNNNNNNNNINDIDNNNNNNKNENNNVNNSNTNNETNTETDINTNTRVNSLTTTLTNTITNTITNNTNNSNGLNTITSTYMNTETPTSSNTELNKLNNNNLDTNINNKSMATTVNDQINFPLSFRNCSNEINVIILSDDEGDNKSFKNKNSNYYSDSESYSYSTSYSEFESLPLEMKSQNRRDFYRRDLNSKSNINLNEIENISFSESIIPFNSFSVDSMFRKPTRSESMSSLDATRYKKRYSAFPLTSYNRIGYSPAQRLYNGIRDRKQSQVANFSGYTGFTSGTGTLSSDLSRQKRHTLSHLPSPSRGGLVGENEQPGTESTRQKATKYLTMLETLLWNDADPNIQDTDGRTSLIIACIYKLRQVVPLLLKYGTSVNTRDYLGKTALMYSCEKQEDGIVKQLLEYHSNINFQDNNGLTALMLACKNDNVEIIRLLLENRARVNRQDNNGDTALTIASRYGCARATRLLLRYCANADIKNKRGETALIIACRHVNEEIIRILIDQPLDMDIQDRNGNTALIYLCQKKYEYTDLVQEFLNKQTLNVNIRNKAGNSALHISAFNDHQDIVRQLLFHHANINLKNGEGNTALMWVSSLPHHEEMAHLLLDFSNVYVTTRNMVKVLQLRKKKKLRMRQCEDLILPYSFISLDETNNEGDTALIIASRSGQPRIVKALLRHHANCNIQNNRFETALVKAIKSMSKTDDRHRIEKYQHVIKLLILNNADTHIKDIKKHDFVYYARSNKLFMELLQNISKRQKQAPKIPKLNGSVQYYRY